MPDDALILQTGHKGKLKASGREFEIVATTSQTSTIRFRGERELHELEDAVLREHAVGIEAFRNPDF